MIVSALAPWFGSKRTLAPRIVEALGAHRVYWEPFAGSLAVLLAKPAVSMETANDMHGDLVNLARVLKSDSHAVDLYARLRRTLMHEAFFEDAAELARDGGKLPAPESPDVDRAEAYMVASWFGRNGMAGTAIYKAGFCVRYTANGGAPATRWRSAIESIPDWHERLRNVVILNRDGFELLGRIDDAAGTAIYLDPPYLLKGAKYVHDFDAADHDRLAALAGRFRRARVVVSYYAHPRLAELYPAERWELVDCSMRKALASQNKRDTANDTKAPEVLLISREGIQ